MESKADRHKLVNSQLDSIDEALELVLDYEKKFGAYRGDLDWRDINITISILTDVRDNLVFTSHTEDLVIDQPMEE